MFRKNDGSPPIQMQGTGVRYMDTRLPHFYRWADRESVCVTLRVGGGVLQEVVIFPLPKNVENWKLSKLIALLYIFLTYKINTWKSSTDLPRMKITQA